MLLVDQFLLSSDTNKDWSYIVHSLFSLLSRPNTTPPYIYEEDEAVIDPYDNVTLHKLTLSLSVAESEQETRTRANIKKRIPQHFCMGKILELHTYEVNLYWYSAGNII